MPVRNAVTRTTFERVGDNVAGTVGKSQSAMPQRGKLVAKGGGGVGGMLEGATAAHRPNIQERMGAQFAPQATLYAPNAAEANDVQRNVRLVNSAIGNRDFYLRRQYQQGM